MTASASAAVTFILRIEPLGVELPIDASATLREAAQAGGVELPTSCRNGTCRACIAQLRQGQVRYRIEWPGLSMDEKAEGWVLPCVAVPLSDLVLEVPAARLLADTPTIQA